VGRLGDTIDRETERAIKEKHEPAIRAMEKRLRRNPDGTLVLDVKRAEELGVDPGASGNLIHSLEETNRKIKSGEIKANDVSTNYDERPKGVTS
jgi:hypothetical protein